MMVQAKNCDISNCSLFGGKLWFPGQKQGLGYNTKYPRMRSDEKTYFLKNQIPVNNWEILNFSLFGGKLWFPGQKQGLGYKAKYPKMRLDQKTYFLKSKDIDKRLSCYKF